MRNFRTLFFTCLFFLSFTSLFSQELSTKNKKAIKLFTEADQLFRQRQFEPGIKKLNEAIEKDPEFVEAYLKLGSVHKLFGENTVAMPYFQKACELNPNDVKLSSAYLTLGQYYFGDGRYEQSKKLFEKVLQLNPNNKAVLETAADLQKRADFGIKATNNPITFIPKLMPNNINKFFIHAYPVLTGDQNTLIFSKRDGPSPADDEDVVISKKANGVWSEPVSISKNINTQFNEGASTMSADGKTLVFVSCNRPEGQGSCDLYISYNVGGEWSEPVNMGPKVNSAAWESEPTISADGKSIYFSSERKGGFGKEDIYITTRDEAGEWTSPRNLGKPVNTKGREVSPFIHADGRTLYFSSTEHLGMGGFDIFLSSKLDTTNWTEPKNLGYPVNTPANDASVFITADNSKGFYSIYEKKGMKHSKILLYEFEVPDEIKPEKISTYAKGTVYDAETKKPIHAQIKLVDLKTNETIQSADSDPETGEYLVVLTEGTEYALFAEEEGYLFKSQSLDFRNAKNFNPMNLDIYLDPVKAGKAVVLNNIFFPTNEFTLEDKSKTELDKIVVFLKKNSTIKIEFGGHTDDVGADKTNMELSLKRAESVYKYIVSKGIESSRLKYKGYGETQPVQPNTNEENRAKNRRIEFKVL